MSIISSPSNQTVKDLVKLRESSKDRRLTGNFTIEGAREWERALRSDFICEAVYYCSKILSPLAKEILDKHQSIKHVEVSEVVFKKLVIRDHSDGVLALMRARKFQLENFRRPQRGLFLVFDCIEKPGNFGALARSADGAGVDGIFVLDPNADLYNPHAIRSSIGAVFSKPIVTCTHQEFYDFCLKSEIKIITASPFAKRSYFEEDLSGNLAVVLGSEAFGLSEFWDSTANKPVKIPMMGLGDSLNVSVAGAIVLYEALRQRISLKV